MTMTLVQAWTTSRKRLNTAGVDSPAIDARLLVEAAADATRADLIADPYRPLSEAQAALLEDYVRRREQREPISHILGRKGFWKIMLSVTSDVLTPRPETEVVVDYALRAFEEHQAFSMLDLGVGSGAIALAILSERPAGKGLGIDISEDALAVARENAANLGLNTHLALMRGDWTAGLQDNGFDLVVANPPYIATDVIPTLDPEVRDHEPMLALHGGADGLDAYRLLAPEILRVLKPGGLFLVEIGYDQAEAVEDFFKNAGADAVSTLRDLSDLDRVVQGRKKSLGS
ncbi:MAG: peptide chain release factor N(5)-glutamine methyltransferase [Caulobacteraceae bacterium]